MEAPTAPTPEAPTFGVSLKTLLLTDLVGSTHLVEVLGDVRAYEFSAAHDRLARDLLARHGGREIDKTDGFLLLFDRPLDALHFALDYHEELARLSRAEGLEVKARAGIHLGEVFWRENSPADVARGAKPLEVEGLAKPTAARLMSLAQGGQTLLSREAFEVCRRALGKTSGSGAGCLTSRGHGLYLFKGVEDPVEVYEIGWEGLAPLIPPPGTDKARRADGEGAGGWTLPRTGRGRLLLAAAAVAVLALASLLLLKLYQRGFIGARPAVAVLGFDNLSQRAEADWLATALAEMLATELAAGEDLRLISGENVARVRREIDLRLGDTLAADTLAQIRTNLGTDYVVVGSYMLEGGVLKTLVIRLQDARSGASKASFSEGGREEDLYPLVSRAGAVLRQGLGFGEISPEEAAAVKATLSESPVATRLYSEGLARLRSYDALAARDLLEQAVATDPQYALAHAALSQAWSQLGYDRRAEASARRAYELAEGLPREDFLIIEGRYNEAAGKWGEAASTYRVLWGYHPDNADHGLRLVRAQAATGRSAEALATIAELRKLPPPARDDPRIDAAEARIYWQLSDYEQQLAVSARAADQAAARDASILLAEILLRRGWTFTRLGRYGEARRELEEARRLFSTAGDRAWATRVLVSLGILAKYEGDMVRAQELYQEALVGLREIGHGEAVTTILNNLAVVAREQGRLAEANSMLDEALAVAEEIGSRSAVALTHENRALVLLDQGDLAGARAAGQRAVDIYAEIGERSGRAWALWDLGQAAFTAGDLAAARPAFEEALSLGREMGYQHLIGQVLTSLGRLHTSAGDSAAAESALAEAVALRSRLSEQGTLAETRLVQAELLLAQGRFAAAGSLAGSALDQLRSEGKAGLHLTAVAVLTEARLGEGKVEEARRAFGAAGEDGRQSESPLVRIRLAVAQARLLAAGGDAAAALELLRAGIAEAERLGLVELALSARLAAVEIERAAGREAQARQEQETLAAEARRLGFQLPLAAGSSG